MKKKIILCFTLILALSMAACGRDKDMTSTEKNMMPAEGEGQVAVVGKMIPSKLPVKEEYDYDYMGIRYVLPEDLRKMLKSGEAWTQNAVEMNNETELNYSSMFFLLAEEGNPGRIYESFEEYEKWEQTTKRFGAITVFRSEYLKEGAVEEITQCKENTELGKSSDGKYVFYLSTNDVGTMTDLFKTTEVTIKDPKKIPTREEDPTFEIMNSSREEVSRLEGFHAQNTDGEKVDSTIFTDYEVTMINLWTTTCGYCIEEMPILETIRTEMQEKGVKFNILGMCLDVNAEGDIDTDKLDKVKEIIKKTGIQYDTIIPDTVLWSGRLKGVNAFPETFFVDSNGKIIGETVLGSNNKDSWQKIINHVITGL